MPHRTIDCQLIGCSECARIAKRGKAHPVEVSTWDLIEKSMKLETKVARLKEVLRGAMEIAGQTYRICKKCSGAGTHHTYEGVSECSYCEGREWNCFGALKEWKNKHKDLLSD